MFEQDTTANDWYMAGTEGTGEYHVIARNNAGRIGIRPLENGTVRVRIEPSSEVYADQLAEYFSQEKGWKQPGEGDQNRFSLCPSKGKEATLTVKSALKALKRNSGKLTRQPSLRFGRWAQYTV